MVVGGAYLFQFLQALEESDKPLRTYRPRTGPHFLVRKIKYPSQKFFMQVIYEFGFESICKASVRSVAIHL